MEIEKCGRAKGKPGENPIESASHHGGSLSTSRLGVNGLASPVQREGEGLPGSALLVIPTPLEALCLLPFFRAHKREGGLAVLSSRCKPDETVRHLIRPKAGSRSIKAFHHVYLHLCGIGPDRAFSSTAEAIRSIRPHAVVMAGTCGALDPTLVVGELVISSAIIPSSDLLLPRNGGAGTTSDRQDPGRRDGYPGRPAPPGMGSSGDPQALIAEASLVERARWACLEAGLKHRVGTMMTSRVPVFSRHRRLKLWETVGACAVDMEDWPVGILARETGSPFVTIRVVSDTVGLDDPGLERWLKTLGSCGPKARTALGILSRPGSIPTLARLGIGIAVALWKLGLFLGAFLAENEASGLPSRPEG
ncbi:MAG: hypothetical protein WHT46_02720 [Candidatus Geothermincolales bacterium]